MSEYQFDIHIFGRYEHYQLIQRIWFLRDVRSTYSAPFFPKIPNETHIYLFSPQLSSLSILSQNVPWDSIKDKALWWTQDSEFDSNVNITNEIPLADTTVSQNSEKSQTSWDWPFEYPLFVNSELKLVVPTHLIDKSHIGKYLQNSAATSTLTPTPHNQNTECNIISSQLENNFISFFPIFRHPTSKKFNNGAFVHDLKFAIQGGIETLLQLRHLTPSISSTDSMYADFNRNRHLFYQGNTTYEPSPDLIAYMLQLQSPSYSPFSTLLTIIPIDLCDEISINHAIWAYHVLLYLYNNNGLLPEQPHTKLVILLFNRTQLDKQIITEQNIHLWFEHFPYEYKFISYDAPFPLSQTNKSSASFYSTVGLPSAAPYSHDPNYLEQEALNISFATQLDQMYTTEIQKKYLNVLFSQTTFPNQPFACQIPSLPLPHIQSSIRYPFPSMIGKVIKLGTMSPIIVPKHMKHWCLFDKYDENFVQDVVKSTPSRTIKTTETLPLSNPFLSFSEPCNIRQNLHHCTQLRIHYCPIEYICSSTTPIWTSKLIVDEINTNVFDFLSMPFSITLPNDEPSPNIIQHSPLLPPASLSSSSLSSSQLQLHLINQIPKYSSDLSAPLNPTLALKSTQNNMIIDHYSVPSIVPVHQYTSLYKLYQHSDNQLNLDLDSDHHDSLKIQPFTPPTKPTKPTKSMHESMHDTAVISMNGTENEESFREQHVQPTTTIYQSHSYPDRYYSTMYIDPLVKQGLTAERSELQHNTEIEDSPLLTTFSSQALQSLTQFMTSPATSPTFTTTATSTPTNDSNPKFSEFFPIQPASKITKITPLSISPHHFHIEQQTTPIDTSIHQFVPYNFLFTYSVINLSSLLVEVNAIEAMRNFIYQKSLRKKIISFFHKNVYLTNEFRYTTQYLQNIHKLDDKSTKSTPSTTNPKSSHSSHKTSSSSNPPSETHQLQTIHRCTLDVPSYQDVSTLTSQTQNATEEHPYFQMSKDLPSLPRLASKIVDGYTVHLSVELKRKNYRNRQVMPHFFIVLNDHDTNPPQDVPNGSYSDKNRPSFLSKEAAMMQSYLSQCVPRANGSDDSGYALHYAFVQLDELQNTIINCIQMAIAMRMDHSNFDFN